MNRPKLIGESYMKGRYRVGIYECPACGRHWECIKSNIDRYTTQSCGCIKGGHSNRTHGMTLTPTYYSWKNMHARCYYSSDINYQNYGERGIKVCERWMYFEYFLEDMGEKPEGMSLDRIDNDGHYFKENCRWATRGEQANNRRNTIILTDNSGETKTLVEWSKIKGIAANTMRMRLRNGWPEHDVIHY